MFTRALRIMFSLGTISLMFPAPVLALECGETIFSSIELTSDLTCSGPGPALIVGADGITVSLNERTISNGGGGDGSILVADRNGVTIKGPGRIVWTGDGIRAVRTDLLTVTGVHFESAEARGIALIHSRRATIQGNRFYSGGVFGAIDISQAIPLPSPPLPAGQHRIIDNTFTHTEVAIRACGADAGGNQIWGNWFEGFIGGGAVELTDEAAGNQIYYNKFRAGAGRLFVSTHYNWIYGNTFEGSGQIDVQAIPGRGCHRRDTALRAVGNRIESNHFYASAYPILLGDDKFGEVSATRLTANTINDATIGISFGPGASYNDGRGNTFLRTATLVEDHGVGNVY